MDKSPIAISIEQALQERSCTLKPPAAVIQDGRPSGEILDALFGVVKIMDEAPVPLDNRRMRVPGPDGHYVELTNGRGDIRQRVEHFEDQLKQMPGQFIPPVQQWFGGGCYLRQVFLPAGTLATGKVHKHSCWNLLIQGELEVVTEDGVKLMVAPCVFESPAGTKRAGRVISDTLWITVHAYEGEEQDPDAMGDLLTVPSFDQLEKYCQTDTPLEG